MRIPEVASFQERLASYGEGKWPHHFENGPTPRQLAEEGFVLEGVGSNPDRCKCVYCGCMLRNWNEGDDIRYVHTHAARMLLKPCPFLVKQSKKFAQKPAAKAWVGIQSNSLGEDLLDGETLFGILISKASVPEKEASRIVRELLEEKKPTVEVLTGSNELCSATVKRLNRNGIVAVISDNPYANIQKRLRSESSEHREETLLCLLDGDSDRYQEMVDAFGDTRVHKLQYPAGATKVLHTHSESSKLRVVVVGDIDSYLEVLKDMESVKMDGKPPAVSFLPNRQANDVSTHFGWNLKEPNLKDSILSAKEVSCDTWRATSCPVRVVDESTKKNQAHLSSPLSYSFLAHLCVGVPALQSLSGADFKRWHEHSDEFIGWRLLKKLRLQVKMAKFLPDFNKLYELKADGSVVSVPSGIKGIVVLNMSRYGGKGVMKEDSIGNGKVTLMGVSGLASLSIGSFKHLGTGSSVSVSPLNSHEMYIQVDGVPSRCPASVVNISHHSSVSALIK